MRTHQHSVINLVSLCSIIPVNSILCYVTSSSVIYLNTPENKYWIQLSPRKLDKCLINCRFIMIWLLIENNTWIKMLKPLSSGLKNGSLHVSETQHLLIMANGNQVAVTILNQDQIGIWCISYFVCSHICF